MPSNIAKLLTPLTVSYWFMDDGSIASDSNALEFATDSFTKEEVTLLCSILNRNYKVNSYLQKVTSFNNTTQIETIGWRVQIPAESYPIMKDLMLPHLLECFYYKLGLDKNKKPVPIPKRQALREFVLQKEKEEDEKEAKNKSN